jgi:uncharacterized membrane protein YcjF (UPF0283 family)
MKTAIGLGALLFVIGVVLALIELWFLTWSPEVFMKLEMTLGGLFLIVVGVAYVVNEYQEDKSTRSGDRLDD